MYYFSTRNTAMLGQDLRLRTVNFLSLNIGHLVECFMRRIFIAILCTLLTAISANACICELESIQQVRQRSIEQSELIFTAKVILEDTTKNFFRLKVIKVYKGTITREIDASGF